MEDSKVEKNGCTKEKLQIESKKVTGSILENHGVDEIMRLLNKKGYRSREALRIRTEMEQSKETYDYLIRNQNKMPGENRRAEAVVKYYLFQLDELKRELPYDAMGCDLTVPLLVMQEFQKKAITEKVMDYLENSDIFSKEELQGEIQRFTTVYLDPRGVALYMDLLEKTNKV